MKLWAKVILPIFFVILVSSACSILIINLQREDEGRLMIKREKKTADYLIMSIGERIKEQYQGKIRNLLHARTDILKLFAERDGVRLRQAVAPIARQFRHKDENFLYFAFILPDNSVLVRVNTPDQKTGNQGRCVSDMIDQDRNVNPDDDGIGFDCNGFSSRLAYPVSYHEKEIGTFVVGIGIEPLIDELRQRLGLHTALLLTDMQVEHTRLPDMDLVPVQGGMVYPDHDSFFTHHAEHIEFDGDSQTLEADGSFFHVFTSSVIHDIDGREIGRMLHSLDVTGMISSHRSVQLRLCALDLALIVLSLLVLYFSFKTILNRSNALNEKLEHQNTVLLEHERQLESKISERTAELEEMNRQLQEEINKRREANRSLQRSVADWQNTFDAITDPVTILDKDLSIVVANHAARQLLGSDNKEITGRYCYELFIGRTSSCRNCPIKKGPSYGRSHEQEVENLHLGKTLVVTCNPIFDHEELLGFVHTARDITHEQNLKKQLIQAQKMEAIATLAGGIAHDFNNILGAILGNADLLLYRIPSQAPDHDGSDGDSGITLQEIRLNLEAIKKAGNRAKELVSQILTFSRQTRTQRRNVVITPIIKEAVKFLRSSLPANIEIDFSMDQDIDRIYADLTQIHQVFMNLCTNAAQSMKEHGGRLTVSLRQIEAGPVEIKRVPDLKPGRYVALSVQDSGHGMSKEVMERIFDPFFTTRDVDEGTGLGLSVLHGIVTAHEGVVDVQSEVGKGSVFTVFFPCVSGVVSEIMEDAIMGLPRGEAKILFVDDEEDIVRMSSRMLEYLGYTVYSATSGDQALSMINGAAADIDLLITDYSMPGMSGLQLAEKMVKIRPNLPVILCSGFNQSVFADESGSEVVGQFLSKPLDMKGLAFAIREILTPG